jgi:hypothetical protein
MEVEMVKNENKRKDIELQLLNKYSNLKKWYNDLYNWLKQQENWKDWEVLNLIKKIDKLLFCFKQYILYLPFKKSFKKPYIQTDYTLRLNYFYEFILTTIYEVFEAFTKYWELKTWIKVQQNNWFKFIEFLKNLKQDDKYNINIDTAKYSNFWIQRGSITHNISPNTEDYISRIQSMVKNNEFNGKADHEKIAGLVESVFLDVYLLTKEI